MYTSMWEDLTTAKDVRESLRDAPSKHIYAQVILVSFDTEDDEGNTYLYESVSGGVRIVDAKTKQGKLWVKCLQPADSEYPRQIWYPAKRVYRER